MKNFWNKVLEILKVIWNWIKSVFCGFFQVFNTKEKISAILLASYTWYTMPLHTADKIQVFILFFVLGVLILNIREGK